jgi:hypothetical protein
MMPESPVSVSGLAPQTASANDTFVDAVKGALSAMVAVARDLVLSASLMTSLAPCTPATEPTVVPQRGEASASVQGFFRQPRFPLMIESTASAGFVVNMEDFTGEWVRTLFGTEMLLSPDWEVGSYISPMLLVPDWEVVPASWPMLPSPDQGIVAYGWPTADRVQDAELVERFNQLTNSWKMEKMFTSSMSAIEGSQFYQAIVNLGNPVVPLLFRELQREPDYWFAALHAILGEDPVPPEDRGNLSKMTEHWLAWAKQCGHVL